MLVKMKKYFTVRNFINFILTLLYLFILALHFDTVLDPKLYTEPFVVISDERPWIMYNKTIYISFMITMTIIFTALLIWGVRTYKKKPEKLTTILLTPVLYLFFWLIMQILFWPNYKG